MAEIGAAFKRIDVDGSGDLTWEEFETSARSFAVAELFADAILSVEGKSSLKTLWASLDVNGDGRVSSREWGSVVSKNRQVSWGGGNRTAPSDRLFQLAGALLTGFDSLLTDCCPVLWRRFDGGDWCGVQAHRCGRQRRFDLGRVRNGCMVVHNHPKSVSGVTRCHPTQPQPIQSQLIPTQLDQAKSNPTLPFLIPLRQPHLSPRHMEQTLATAEGKEQLRALFEALDVNGDGSVSSREWGQQLRIRI